MSLLNIIPAFSRLSVCTAVAARNIFTDASPLHFRFSNPLLAEPLKKKKKLDPAIIRAREEKKKRRIEKQIRRLQKSTRTEKPLKELEVPEVLLHEKEVRLRHLSPLSNEELEERILLHKEWTKYKSKQCKLDAQIMNSVLSSQERALAELRAESEELYQEAIQIDPVFIPYKANGPVRTPPIKNYDSPDGEYIDITPKYAGES